ncbi:uncharacterized protein LOC144331820 [Macaca mulatta]
MQKSPGPSLLPSSQPSPVGLAAASSHLPPLGVCDLVPSNFTEQGKTEKLGPSPCRSPFSTIFLSAPLTRPPPEHPAGCENLLSLTSRLPAAIPVPPLSSTLGR